MSANISNQLFLFQNKLNEANQSHEKLLNVAKEIEENHLNLLEVRAFFSAYLDKMTVERIKLIEETINYGLNFIFGYPITIEITKQFKSNKTFFTMVVNNNGAVGGAESHGGGVLAVISFLFKFVILTKFKYMKLMVLDESLAFVSSQYQERTSLLLRELADKFGVDILLISHQPKLNTHASTVYEMAKKNGSLEIASKQTNNKENDYE